MLSRARRNGGKARNRPAFPPARPAEPARRRVGGPSSRARTHAQGWSYGIAEHLTKHGLLFCVDAHRDGKRFIVKADDLLTAFLSLERDAIAQKDANGNGTRENMSGIS